MSCINRFGEFSPDEFSGEEFFVGLQDCSEPTQGIKCTNLFIYSKPYINSQSEIDYNLLFDYIKKDLESNLNVIEQQLEIGIVNQLQMDFGEQAFYLVSFLLLFKEELKKNPTVENYALLFAKYKLDCVNKKFGSVYKKYKWIKDMLKLLNIGDLINIDQVQYQFNDELDLDPVYYLVDL